MCNPLTFKEFGIMKQGTNYRIISINNNVDEIMRLEKVSKKDKRYYFNFLRNTSNNAIYLVIKGFDAENNRTTGDDNIIYE